jgi:16S rRNA (adenine1518-N6/adenine1519-N6)-dimethyltransferase
VWRPSHSFAATLIILAIKGRTQISHDIVAKKSLGQHFLHDEIVCQRVVDAAALYGAGNLLEVGPGPGALTKYLADMPQFNLKCVELDREKVAYLQQHFPSLQGKVIEGDILRVPSPFDDKFALVGNFPYNISTQIVFRVLEWHMQVPYLVGMFQKEVAERLASKHGKKSYGITSVLAQCYYDVELLFDVQPTSFTPPPKVMSSVLCMRHTGNRYHIKDFAHFTKFVKAAFSQRRKTLRNCFKGILSSEVLSESVFEKRAEHLSPQEFVMLYERTFVV